MVGFWEVDFMVRLRMDVRHGPHGERARSRLWGDHGIVVGETRGRAGAFQVDGGIPIIS